MTRPSRWPASTRTPSGRCARRAYRSPVGQRLVHRELLAALRIAGERRLLRTFVDIAPTRIFELPKALQKTAAADHAERRKDWKTVEEVVGRVIPVWADEGPEFSAAESGVIVVVAEREWCDAALRAIDALVPRSPSHKQLIQDARTEVKVWLRRLPSLAT